MINEKSKLSTYPVSIIGAGMSGSVEECCMPKQLRDNLKRRAGRESVRSHIHGGGGGGVCLNNCGII